MPEDSAPEKVKKPRAPRKPRAAQDAAKPRAPRKPAAGKKPAEAKAPAEAPKAEAPKHEVEKEGGELLRHRATDAAHISQQSCKTAFRPESKLFAVVRVRGSVGITRQLSDTLMMLRLHRINHCVIIPKNHNYEGMLQKARYFITWGEIDGETLEKLVAKRGRFAGDRKVRDLEYAKELAHFMLSGKPAKETGIKPVFRLSPPSKGYESTKSLYPKGSLGYRGEKINELIKRMI